MRHASRRRAALCSCAGKGPGLESIFCSWAPFMRESRRALSASGSCCSASCSAQKGLHVFPAFARLCSAI